MKKMIRSWVVVAAWCAVAGGCSRGAHEKGSAEELSRGKELFSHFCAGCHPDGSNAIYPQKSLHGMDLAANGVRTADDIVAIMRHPGRGMRTFDRTILSDDEARAIAAYVLTASGNQ